MREGDYGDFWQEAVTQLKAEFDSGGKEAEFERWISDIAYLRSENGKIIVSMPSTFYYERIKKQGYDKLLESKLNDLIGQQIEFVVEVREQSAKAQKNAQPSKQEKSSTTTNAAPQKISPPTQNHPQLRSDYSFETFIPDNNNPMPYNAALATSKNPGKAYNPLLFYGGVGLGKTHLMQAIGNALYQNSGGKSKIIYVTAETFTNDFTTSIRTNTMPQFKSKYRNVDVLLIDDIHFLQKKEETQEELFYTFEALYNSYKQMVFTCDRPVSELKDVTDRLKSRFTRGLQSDLKMPKYETRRAILEKKLEVMGKSIPPEVIDLIAQNVETNIRDLEASLTKLLAYVELVNKDITVEIAQQQLRDTFNAPNNSGITSDIIQKIIANHYGLSPSDLRGQKRSKAVVMPRHIALYIAGELTQSSTTELGRDFGGRDHTTVMYSQEKIASLIQTDSKMDAEIQLLMRKVKDYKAF
jgi:chromosomal replication initiator protein